MAYRLAAFAALVFGACGIAQMASAQAPKPSPAHAPQAPTAPSAPNTAPSLLDHPAQPAKITFNAGKLSIQADNSILADILHEVAKESGMKIEGLDAGSAADRRIFGSYGPGAPRDVLSDLLSDSGYNFLMLGDTSSGAPRELALTSRSGGAPSAAPQPTPTANTQQEQNNPDEPLAAQQPDEPQNSPEPPPGPPEIQNRVRTPQQMLQELQRMHQQQQQQQQEQQQDQPDQPDQPDQSDQPPDPQPD